MQRRRLFPLTILALAGVAATAPAAQAADTLTGAGSTLVAPLMARWGADYQASKGVSITYGAVGSGAGIAQISARTVDFGASDAPLNPQQSAACNGCVQIPWALTATGIAFRIDGVRKLKLTGQALSQIYLGSIKNWSDPRIKRLNKGVKLPNLGITVAFRSDGSGDTYAFTDYLSHVSPSFKSKVGFATSVSFPTGVGGKGNDGITAVVSGTNGSIGYISASYIVAHNLGAAALKNAAGRYEYPNLRNIKAAGDTVKKVPAGNAMHIVNPPKAAKRAYPLSTFTYVIVPKSSRKLNVLSPFIGYVLTTGQKFGPALDFAPIPKVVLSASRKTLAGLSAG